MSPIASHGFSTSSRWLYSSLFLGFQEISITQRPLGFLIYSCVLQALIIGLFSMDGSVTSSAFDSQTSSLDEMSPIFTELLISKYDHVFLYILPAFCTHSFNTPASHTSSKQEYAQHPTVRKTRIPLTSHISYEQESAPLLPTRIQANQDGKR